METVILKDSWFQMKNFLYAICLLCLESHSSTSPPGKDVGYFNIGEQPTSRYRRGNPVLKATDQIISATEKSLLCAGCVLPALPRV